MDYQKHYNLLIDRARHRKLECYTESHHIVPRCLGGDDSKENLVDLTAEEHYIAHLLLVKIHPNHHGLVWAAIQMTGHSNGQRSSNKIYGWLKRRYQKVAKARIGDKNGSTGSIWINRIGTLENRKIGKDEPIPEGWKRGRKLKEKLAADKKTCKCGSQINYRATSCNSCAKRDRPPVPVKLTEEDVRKIKHMITEGIDKKVIAKQFDITQWTVYDIGLERTWSHVTIE